MKAIHFSPLLCLLLPACGGGGGGSGSLPVPQNESDPLYSAQWHLKNTGQLGASAGVDINVEPVWQQGNEGNNVVVAVNDDGVQTGHQDLAPNMVANRSLNFSYPGNGHGANNPEPDTADDDHGTAVTGLIAAARNHSGGRGAAPRARLVGNNLLVNFTAVNISTALLQASDIVSISNNSWGSPDNTSELSSRNPLSDAAITAGSNAGRGGRGIVYLFAAGNGADYDSHADSTELAYRTDAQRSSYDAYNNHPAQLNIGALAADGSPAPYTEPGPNVLVSAPSNGFANQPGLYTTALMGSQHFSYLGRIYRNYRPDFGGTSGATPLVSGVVALMLRANPALSWRDVRWILAKTAVPLLPANDVARERGPAAVNSVYSHYAGYGRVNATAAVAAARNFMPLPAQQQCSVDFAANQPLPDGNGQSLQLDANLANCAISTVEAVELIIDAPQHLADELAISLQSPLGRSSVFATAHRCSDDDGTPRASCLMTYNNWRFSSIRHLGETFSSGPWRLQLTDSIANNGVRNLNSARLIVHGY